MQKKISVIIPCYNIESFIDICLASVENQTIGMESLEVILVNDASTDHTLSHLMAFEHRYPESVMVIPLEHNLKQGGARNVALSYATGEYVVFLDGDDWIEPDFYENLYRLAKEYDTDVIQYSITNVTTDEEGNITSRSEDFVSGAFGYHEINTDEQRVWFLNHRIVNYGSQTKFYKREFLIANEPRFMEGVAYEEPSFVYPLLYAMKKVYVYERPQYICRQHAESTMHSYVRQKGKLYDHPKVQLAVLHAMRLKSDIYQTFQSEIEYYFLFTFYFETVHFAKRGNLYLGYDFFQIMQQLLKTIGIAWRENRYINMEQNRDVYELLDGIEKIESEESFEEFLNNL